MFLLVLGNDTVYLSDRADGDVVRSLAAADYKRLLNGYGRILCKSPPPVSSIEMQNNLVSAEVIGNFKNGILHGSGTIVRVRLEKNSKRTGKKHFYTCLFKGEVWNNELCQGMVWQRVSPSSGAPDDEDEKEVAAHCRTEIFRSFTEKREYQEGKAKPAERLCQVLETEIVTNYGVVATGRVVRKRRRGDWWGIFLNVYLSALTETDTMLTVHGWKEEERIAKGVELVDKRLKPPLWLDCVKHPAHSDMIVGTMLVLNGSWFNRIHGTPIFLRAGCMTHTTFSGQEDLLERLPPVRPGAKTAVFDKKGRCIYNGIALGDQLMKEGETGVGFTFPCGTWP